MQAVSTIPSRPFWHFPLAIRPGREVQYVKAKSFKIGRVTIHPDGTGWRLRYQDPATGRDVRRKLDGVKRKDVEAVAIHINREVMVNGGYVPGERPRAPEIAEALADAIRLAGCLPATRSARARNARFFCKWLGSFYPRIKTWDELRPAILQHYANSLVEKGLAFDTIRLALEPIKMTWRYCSENWPELVRAVPRVKIKAQHKRVVDCLERGEVLILLDWLREHAPDLWPMACLQGLAGLRVQEAAALRRQDIDLVAGTVEVTDTGHHRPKTKASYRVIPVCDEVLEALRWAVGQQKVRPLGGELFTNSNGELWTVNGLGHRWRRALRHAAAKPERIVRANTGKPLTINPHGLNIPRLAQVPPRKLRAAFVTMAARMGCNESLLSRYVGHAAKSVLGIHYRAVDLSELRTVSSTLNGVRSTDTKEESGNILAFQDSEAL